MKKFIPLLVAFVLLWVTFALLIAAFIGHFWMKVKTNADKYGLWEACSGETSECYKWFENGQDIFEYKLSSKIKFSFFEILFCFCSQFFMILEEFIGFQAFQCIYLILTAVSICSVLANIVFYKRTLLVYILNAIILLASCTILDL